MSDNTKDIKIAERTRPTPGDVEASAPKSESPAAAAPTQTMQLRPFKDGIVLRHSANPRNPKTRVIHDSTGTPLAVCLFPDIADMICNAVSFLFQERARLQQEQLKQLDEMSAVDAVPSEQGQNGEVPFTPIAAPALKVVDSADITDPPASNP